MIMPCMNSMSFGELGGNVARVSGGSVLVGWPGAPGCTMTGVAVAACCAQTGADNKPVRTPKASRQLGRATNLINIKWSNVEALTLSQSGKILVFHLMNEPTIFQITLC